jgi:hypothetical protein
MSNVLDIDSHIVVLNDLETYSSAEGSFVCFLSPAGVHQLDYDNKIYQIDESNVIERVSISDLIDCWLQARKLTPGQ